MADINGRFYNEKDLIAFIKEHGSITMDDMNDLWRNSLPKFSKVAHYYIYDCITSYGSCGETWVFPAKNFNVTK